MHFVQIYRGNLPLLQVKPSDDSLQMKRIMGENEIRLNFIENQYIDFKIGDKAQIFGEWYYLNLIPEVIKSSSVSYDYQMVLKSTASILEKVQYLFLGSDNSLKEGEFSLTGKAIDFLNLIIQNSKRLLPDFEFTLGQIDNTDYKTLTFSTENCLAALGKIAEAFETEYWIEGVRISLTAMGRDTGYSFRQGKQKGLYELVRKTVNNQNVITRLYAFGSEKNLPENYRSYSKRLKLPSQGRHNVTNVNWIAVDNGDGTQTFTFNWDPPDIVDAVSVTMFYKPISDPGGMIGLTVDSINSPRVYTLPVGELLFLFRTDAPGGVFYDSPFVPSTAAQPALPFAGEVIFIEKNVSKYGLSEATIMYDDIYPHRTGTVTGINLADEFEFTDTGMDFDLNSYLLPGATAKVTFNTGQLSGYTFEVHSYDHGFKRFIILKNKNERALDIPSSLLKPAIGDKYVITDIKMPQTYIDEAEAALLVRAQSDLDIFSEPQLSYQLVFDSVYLKDKQYQIKLGDLIWIIDDPMQVQRKFRVITAQRGLVNEYDFEVEIADIITKSKIQALVSGQSSLTQSVSNLNSNMQNNSILNNRVIGDLIITSQGGIKFENIGAGGITAIGIDANGRICTM